ncbi:MAG: AAC(3) family N-acetyltransferase [Neomegalonema sp.]|nr:AAC(3) family N-acetyltransferase [Neomegalonema sp.]
MTERDVIAATREPISRARLRADLGALGVTQGDALLVHISLSSIGWVIGGARTVIEALMEVISAEGLLAMPAFSGDVSDPADWENPPVPARWVDQIRAETPAFDPAKTPTMEVGRTAELFRTWPGVVRSSHPQTSIAAWGRGAEALCASHPIAMSFGDGSPLAKLYERDAKLLLLGVGHERNSSLHLAESRAAYGRRVRKRTPTPQSGKVVWKMVEEVTDDVSPFPTIGAAFDASGAVRIGAVGQARARLMRQRALVDFARSWFDSQTTSQEG